MAAIETGLRAGELRCLTVSSFDFENRTVTVIDAYSKNRKESILPLRPKTATELKAFFKGKLPAVKAFGGSYKQLTDRTADVLKLDLAAADIKYIKDGFFFDFHAHRHETGTLLAASGASPAVAQSIMRHSSVSLTMNVYTHTLIGQEAEAISNMPDLSLPSSEKSKKAGA
jgi:integrase